MSCIYLFRHARLLRTIAAGRPRQAPPYVDRHYRRVSAAACIGRRHFGRGAPLIAAQKREHKRGIDDSAWKRRCHEARRFRASSGCCRDATTSITPAAYAQRRRRAPPRRTALTRKRPMNIFTARALISRADDACIDCIISGARALPAYRAPMLLSLGLKTSRFARRAARAVISAA